MAAAGRGRSSQPAPAAGLRETLELVRARLRRDAAGELAAAVRRLVGRSGPEAGLDLAGDEETARFLWRLGWLGRARAGRARDRRVAEVAAAAAREAGLSGLEAALLLRLFAAGDRGLGIEPVCGEMPRCSTCELGGACRFRLEAAGRPEPARTERPAERLRREGEDALTAAELLALVLSGKGLAEGEALALARRLVGQAGSLRELAARPLAELAAAEGMDGDLAGRVRAALGLARRWNVEERALGRQFKGGADFLEFFAPQLRDVRQETFLVVLLDQKNRYLGHEAVSTGTLTGTLVHPREVFRPAIRGAAAAVAFVHNHPSGCPEPSRDDREITARLLEVARVVGVRVLDHVVLGEGRYFSFAESGLL